MLHSTWNGVANTNVIRNGLIKAGFPECTEVLPHITGFQKANPEIKHNTLFKIITSNQFDEKIIGEIDALFYVWRLNSKKSKETKLFNAKSARATFIRPVAAIIHTDVLNASKNTKLVNAPKMIIRNYRFVVSIAREIIPRITTRNANISRKLLNQYSTKKEEHQLQKQKTRRWIHQRKIHHQTT